MGWRRCGEEFAFLIRLKQERYRASEKRKRAKAGVTTRGRGLVGIGNGDTPLGKQPHTQQANRGPDTRGHVLLANRKTTGAKGKLTCCVPQRREPGNRGDRQVEVEPCAWMDMRDGHGRPQAEGEKAAKLPGVKRRLAYYKDIGDGKRVGCLKKGTCPRQREHKAKRIGMERRKQMVCKSCQLVEMARVARQGEVDVYRCPKCGREERVRVKPEER